MFPSPFAVAVVKNLLLSVYSYYLSLLEFVSRQGDDNALVLPKIESVNAVKNLDEIITASDGAMVARGDLGAELPEVEVPLIQSEIVTKCSQQGKPVIVATNMLESMIDNPCPTRAEVADITIAVREGADCVMLSGETANGKYPVKALQVTTKEMSTKQQLRLFPFAWGMDACRIYIWIAKCSPCKFHFVH